MSRNRILALLLALAAWPLVTVPVAVAASDPPCAAGLGVGLVDFPNTRDPRARNYIVDHVRPGTTFSRRFQVCNGTAQPVTVNLYAGAAEVGDGAFRIVEGRGTNELSQWVTVDPPRATLQPGQRLLARATFAVPSGAESGERYGVLLAELPVQQGATGIPVANRVGVRVYLDVGEGGAPRSDFVVDSLQAGRDEDGKGVITAQVHNTGRRALDIGGDLTLREGPGGLSGGPYPAKVATTLAPGERAPVVISIERSVAGGPWTARLTLRSGLVERRVEAGLTFPDVAGTSAAPVDVEQLPVDADQDVRPWRSIAAVAGFLLIVLVVALLRRRPARA